MNIRRQTSLRVVLMMGATLVLSTNTMFAQNTSGPTIDEQKLDQQVELMRKDLRSQKKQIIAANLKLTDQEAEKFWPVYDRYTGELIKLNDTKYSLIKEYAQNFGSMSDDRLDKSAREWLGLDESVAQLRLKYLPTFRSVLSAKNNALFYQLDRRIENMINLKVASGIPLIQP